MTIHPVTDISRDHWTQRVLPESWRPYALLIRLDRPIGIWLLLLPALWAMMLAATGPLYAGLQGWWTMALFAAGAVIMRGAGCIINDLWDREIDKKVERTRMRPLAGGAISPQKAMIALAILLLAGGVILLQFNWLTIWLGVLTLPLIVLYPLMKRITYWPQAFLGIVFNFGALMGWTVFRGQIDPPALFLYAACVFWTLGYDTIYAHQDREDDVMAGVKSTALRLGAYSRPAVMGFYGLHALLLMSAIINTYQLYGGNLLFSYSFLAMILLPALTLGVMIRLQRWNTASPGDSLQLFRENGIYGAFVLILLYFAGL